MVGEPANNRKKKFPAARKGLGEDPPASGEMGKK